MTIMDNAVHAEQCRVLQGSTVFRFVTCDRNDVAVSVPRVEPGWEWTGRIRPTTV